MSASRRDALLEILPGCDLPADLAEWLRRGLEAQRAGGDLLAVLELEGVNLDRRDDLLRTVISLTPVGSITARCAFISDCLKGLQKHQRADVQAMIETLIHIDCPCSLRHLQRVTNGVRQDGWRQREARLLSVVTGMPVCVTGGENKKIGATMNEKTGTDND